ncbi:MAG: LysM peptidoglycan-binding domain-containing protein, partial [Cyanobium sp.]
MSAAHRAQLTALELDLMRQLSPATSGVTAADLSPVLSSLQRQIDQLRENLQSLQQEKQQSDLAYRTREQEFSRTIAELRSQVAALEARPSTGVAIATAPGSGPSATTPPAEPEPPKEAPPFRPTLIIKGSVNMVVGGVTGDSTSLSSNFWTARVQNANRDFSNLSTEIAPNLVTGATNRAGGVAYAYYREGQSNLFYPPNGLEAVNGATAFNYAMTSSWTGGKVKFDSLSRGGNLIIADPNDPNYVLQNPRTLDRAGYELTVNLKGQPVLPNAGLGGLKGDLVPLQQVSARDFNLGNLGSDITFANIPMGERDVQNLLDLANASRELKLRGIGADTGVYITKSGDTISSIAFNYGITAADLQALNTAFNNGQGLNLSIPIAQGSQITVPTVPCVKLCVGVNQVANGGLVQNTAFYDDLLNLSIAEYGSLTGKQRNNSRVLLAAQTFIRDLVGTTRNDDLEFEDFNFQRSYTFNNDVKLHFQASFFGPDLLNVSLRYRNFVPYGERGRFPALNLAYGFGGINEANVVFDRLYWQVPLFKGSYFYIGTRYKDYNFLPVSYGTFYPVEQQNYFFA